MNPVNKLMALILSLALLLTVYPASLAENAETALWKAQERRFGTYTDETDDGVLFPVLVTSGEYHLAICLRLEGHMDLKAGIWLDKGGEYEFLDEITVGERGSRYPIYFYSGEDSGLFLSHHADGVYAWSINRNGELEKTVVNGSKSSYEEYFFQASDEEDQFQNRFHQPNPLLYFSSDSFLSASISDTMLQTCFMMKMDLASINGGN